MIIYLITWNDESLIKFFFIRRRSCRYFFNICDQQNLAYHDKKCFSSVVKNLKWIRKRSWRVLIFASTFAKTFFFVICIVSCQSYCKFTLNHRKLNESISDTDIFWYPTNIWTTWSSYFGHFNFLWWFTDFIKSRSHLSIRTTRTTIKFVTRISSFNTSSVETSLSKQS